MRNPTKGWRLWASLSASISSSALFQFSSCSLFFLLVTNHQTRRPPLRLGAKPRTHSSSPPCLHHCLRRCDRATTVPEISALRKLASSWTSARAPPSCSAFRRFFWRARRAVPGLLSKKTAAPSRCTWGRVDGPSDAELKDAELKKAKGTEVA
jgi:hypothetical protein